MSKKELKVCWLSAGVSSFIAGYLKRDSIDLYIYIDIENQHPDSMRFIKDCEKILGKEILILKSPYRNKENVSVPVYKRSKWRKMYGNSKEKSS